MDETQEKSVIERSKEKIGNAIDRLALLQRLFIDHGHYGGSFPKGEQAEQLSEVRLQHIPAPRSTYRGGRLKTHLVCEASSKTQRTYPARNSGTASGDSGLEM